MRGATIVKTVAAHVEASASPSAPRRRLLRKTLVTAAAVGAILLPSWLSADAGPELTMRVTPAHSPAPANVRIQIRIEPHAENRVLVVVADSEEFFRSSEIQLDGDRAPRTLAVEFRSLPAGEYVVESVLTDASGSPRASLRRHMLVTPSGVDR
jgi:hypothetical protein